MIRLIVLACICFISSAVWANETAEKEKSESSTRGIIDFKRPADAEQLVGATGHTFIPESKYRCQWTFEDGVLTASPKWDSVITPDSYQDFRMHLEFNVNEVPDVHIEKNGNSGVYIQQRYELQILNSHDVAEEDYTASYGGSIYRQKKPDKLVCKPAGEWQTFDIAFRAARFVDGKRTENARLTVYQNGTLIHDDYPLKRQTGVGKKEEPFARPIKLQGHHNPVKFRNVWIQRLTIGEPAAHDMPPEPSQFVRQDAVEPIAMVDCHVHLWDIERREGLGWIAEDNKTLFRSILPEYHAPIARANNVEAVVIVQAGQSLPDNQWNLDITASNKDLYRGVVGNLSEVIGTKKFAPLFLKLCKDERYVGYRLSGKYQDELTDAFYDDLRLTASKGKTVDFLIGGYDLDDVAEIANRVPDLKIILDHFGNVRLDGKPLDPDWVRKFRNVAKKKNVYCKFSALYGRVKKQPAPRDIEFYRPVLDLAFQSFGEDRLIYGSDWPVTKTSGDYASVVKLTKAYFAEKEPSVAEKVFRTNAMEFYGIETR